MILDLRVINLMIRMINVGGQMGDSLKDDEEPPLDAAS